MKLSFSINSKSKPASLPKPASASADADEYDAVSASTALQFVTEFDPTKPLSSKPEPDKAVIAPIPNADYIRRFKPTLPLPSAEDDPSQFSTEENFVLDTNSSADPSGLPYGLSIRPDKEKVDASEREENGRGRKRGEKPEDRVLKRFKEDMQNLPDETGPVNYLQSSFFFSFSFDVETNVQKSSFPLKANQMVKGFFLLVLVWYCHFVPAPYLYLAMGIVSRPSADRTMDLASFTAQFGESQWIR